MTPLTADDFYTSIRKTQELLDRFRFHESFLIPRDAVYVIEGKRYVHPSMMMRIQNGGRVPLWSQRTLGDRELQRDRRRRRVASTTRR